LREGRLLQSDIRLISLDGPRSLQCLERVQGMVLLRAEQSFLQAMSLSLTGTVSRNDEVGEADGLLADDCYGPRRRSSHR
jgi:hypothetical protein